MASESSDAQKQAKKLCEELALAKCDYESADARYMAVALELKGVGAAFSAAKRKFDDVCRKMQSAQDECLKNFVTRNLLKQELEDEVLRYTEASAKDWSAVERQRHKFEDHVEVLRRSEEAVESLLVLKTRAYAKKNEIGAIYVEVCQHVDLLSTLVNRKLDALEALQAQVTNNPLCQCLMDAFQNEDVIFNHDWRTCSANCYLCKMERELSQANDPGEPFAAAEFDASDESDADVHEAARSSKRARVDSGSTGSAGSTGSSSALVGR